MYEWRNSWFTSRDELLLLFYYFVPWDEEEIKLRSLYTIVT